MSIYLCPQCRSPVNTFAAVEGEYDFIYSCGWCDWYHEGELDEIEEEY